MCWNLIGKPVLSFTHLKKIKNSNPWVVEVSSSTNAREAERLLWQQIFIRCLFTSLLIVFLKRGYRKGILILIWLKLSFHICWLYLFLEQRSIFNYTRKPYWPWTYRWSFSYGVCFKMQLINESDLTTEPAVLAKFKIKWNNQQKISDLYLDQKKSCWLCQQFTWQSPRTQLHSGQLLFSI